MIENACLGVMYLGSGDGFDMDEFDVYDMHIIELGNTYTLKTW
jgi:hypothetical protein